MTFWWKRPKLSAEHVFFICLISKPANWTSTMNRRDMLRLLPLIESVSTIDNLIENLSTIKTLIKRKPQMWASFQHVFSHQHVHSINLKALKFFNTTTSFRTPCLNTQKNFLKEVHTWGFLPSTFLSFTAGKALHAGHQGQMLTSDSFSQGNTVSTFPNVLWKLNKMHSSVSTSKNALWNRRKGWSFHSTCVELWLPLHPAVENKCSIRAAAETDVDPWLTRQKTRFWRGSLAKTHVIHQKETVKVVWQVFTTNVSQLFHWTRPKRAAKLLNATICHRSFFHRAFSFNRVVRHLVSKTWTKNVTDSQGARVSEVVLMRKTVVMSRVPIWNCNVR